MTARAPRAARFWGDASVYSVAMVEARVAPTEKSERGICAFPPMTMSTAIVSPRARPAPNEMAPRIPDLALGKITLRST